MIIELFPPTKWAEFQTRNAVIPGSTMTATTNAKGGVKGYTNETAIE